tara:strand:- start:16 stop:633 length:618 start_codon:yes stop_codon:yes gene_type:complete
MGVISNGTTLLDAGALDSGIATGAMTLIKTVTISSDTANISFIHGTSGVVFDSTYKEYVFKYINMHPAANAKTLEFNLSVDSFSSTAVKTTTFFRAYHDEADSDTTLSYDTGEDEAQNDSGQTLGELIGADNDQSASGFLHLYDPASTTFVKHFRAETSYSQQADYAFRGMMGGYANVTAAINSIQFKFVGANIGSGTIKMYGIS